MKHSTETAAVIVRTKSACGLTSRIITGGTLEERSTHAAAIIAGGDKLVALIQTIFNNEPRIEVLTRKGKAA